MSIPNQGSTEPWYPNKPTDGNGQPITPVTLSDGQKWYPKKRIELPVPKGKKVRVLHLDNGSYLHIDKLVDPKSRELLTYLTENLKYQDNVRVGVFGPTIKECKKLLEVTA